MNGEVTLADPFMPDDSGAIESMGGDALKGGHRAFGPKAPGRAGSPLPATRPAHLGGAHGVTRPYSTPNSWSFLLFLFPTLSMVTG